MTGGLLARVNPALAATLPQRPAPRPDPAPVDRRPEWRRRAEERRLPAKVLP